MALIQLNTFSQEPNIILLARVMKYNVSLIKMYAVITHSISIATYFRVTSLQWSSCNSSQQKL